MAKFQEYFCLFQLIEDYFANNIMGGHLKFFIPQLSYYLPIENLHDLMPKYPLSFNFHLIKLGFFYTINMLYNNQMYLEIQYK